MALRAQKRWNVSPTDDEDPLAPVTPATPPAPPAADPVPTAMPADSGEDRPHWHPPSPVSDQRWPRMAAAIGAVVLVVAVVLALVEWRHADAVGASAGDRTDASQVAGTFTQDLLTFDSTQPTAQLNRLKAMATTAYEPKIAQARQAALSGSTSSVQTKATAEITQVFLTDVSGDRASAVCEATWELTSAGQLSPPLDFYVKIDLRKVAGTWKVNNVLGLAALASGSGSSGSSSSSPTTTTTPPTTGTTP